MFQSITLKNFRTHTDTSIDLGAVNLLIGPNNSGKSNLLAGLRHFARLAARGRPPEQLLGVDEYEIQQEKNKIQERKKLRHSDLFLHRHRLATLDSVMSFSCLWKHKIGKVEYMIELYEDTKLQNDVGCREKIKIWIGKSGISKELRTGWDKPSDELSLRIKLESEELQDKEKELTNIFFRDLAGCYVYQFQPSFLKGDVSVDYPKVDPDKLSIAYQLGSEGGNLQEILNLVRHKYKRTYNRFIASLRRFERSFHGIEYDRRRHKIIWLFDLGRVPARLDEFHPDLVSDGLLRAAAIALLSSMHYPPALILVEEIENGISQKNIGRFLSWLRQATGTASSTDRGYNTQFFATSHSPSVLREFSDHLDDVFYVRLERQGYKSIVRNLNESLASFVDMGTVEGEFEERDGKSIVKISPENLLDLWYSGIIGGEI